jgi:hypothetical protein
MRRARLTLLLAALGAATSGCSLCDCMRDRVYSARRPHEDRERAGNPEEVSECAGPSDTGSYVGYMVGGGAAYCGDGPAVEDGTWGWDYQGWCWPSKVVLGWWHGRRHQGGEGAYKTDGPRPLEAVKECVE